MKRILVTAAFLSTALMSVAVDASLSKAKDLFEKNRRSVKYYPSIAKELANDGLYFSAIPFVKEYMMRGQSIKNKSIDIVIDSIITEVGGKQFETLPKSALNKSNAPSVRYILAKKYFRAGKYTRALSEARKVYSADHPSKPFALFMEGSIYSLQKKYKSAVLTYKKCIDAAEDHIGDTNDEDRLRQLKITRDYCIVGIPRAEFAAGKFKAAHSHYMDLSKSSHVWPEIIFEEAWTSFYLKDYNRTLGKLVTYKAPLFAYLFNPEIEILRALTFMEMCLWSDAKVVVNDFYSKYSRQATSIRNELDRVGKNFKYYYKIGKARVEGASSSNQLKDSILKAVVGDSAFGEMYQAFQQSRAELEKLNKMRKSSFKRSLAIGLRDTLIHQRNLIGAYVRRGMLDYMKKMDRAFEGMSYIKLEVLARRKAAIYDLDVSINQKRGDINNLQRTDKQYFWTFNGEFWADELGDYVFSLKSNCK
ncbi:MAG: tetratricopeptide repeat protein [Bacteriovoracaceae bacterium]|nr:tetratricopeptide repeat protein [Bacteriovoracaceae bacterium]